MRSHTVSALLVLVGLAPATVAWTRASSDTLELQPASRLWVSGTSTVRSFECKATTLDAQVASSSDAVRAVLAGTKAVQGAVLTVAANELDCGNGTMNDHMKKALKAAEQPKIVFRLSSYDLAKGTEGTRVTLNGTLALGGTEKPITMQATAKEGEQGALRVAGTYELRMTEFGLKPPTLMMGTMKVNELVKVNFDVLLKD